VFSHQRRSFLQLFSSRTYFLNWNVFFQIGLLFSSVTATGTGTQRKLQQTLVSSCGRLLFSNWTSFLKTFDLNSDVRSQCGHSYSCPKWEDQYFPDCLVVGASTVYEGIQCSTAARPFKFTVSRFVSALVVLIKWEDLEWTFLYSEAARRDKSIVAV